MKIRKWAACALALAMTAASLGSCGPQTIAANETTAAQSTAGTAAVGSSTASGSAENLLDPNNPVTVTFYSYSLGYPTMKAGMEHLINSFNETVGKEKGVIVEGVVDDMTKYKTDIQAGNQVDIIQHPFGTLDASRQSLGIQAYEDIFPADELAEHLEGISENAQALGKIDGKMYALAFTFSTPILYINEELFTEAGLDPSNPPTTWEETLEAAQTIKEKTGKDGFGMAANNGWVTEGLIFSNGSDMVSADGNQAVFANDQTVEAFEMWKSFYTSGCAAVGTDSDVMQQFMAGNLAMNLQSTSMLSGYANAAEEGGWTLSGAPMPSFGDKEAVPVNSGSCLAVRADSDQKAQAIWEFVKYATGDEGYTIITSEIGYLPLRTYLADDPNYLKGYVDEHPLLRINLEQLSHIRPVTIWRGDVATECSTIFNDAVVEAITTDADVRTVLTEAQDNINQLLQQ